MNEAHWADANDITKGNSNETQTNIEQLDRSPWQEVEIRK